MSIKNPVRALNAEVARKIAAGEVIDRPNAIVRELMDNSIDSGATEITVEISGGGIEKIRLIDNGCGMTKEDLQNCARPHATSKISSETDLLNLSTLGFRGEALSSIAAVSRLSIASGGWKMRASITEDHILEPYADINGTIVQSQGLFENFPARRQFLKRAATEGMMCKNTFIEKTLARPDIAFRFVQDGQTKIDLPANQTLKERFVMANGYTQSPELFFTIENSSSGKKYDDKDKEWSFEVVIGEPAVSRPSKKEIVIYANGRKIQEYSLVQAVEYGCQGFFPNGTYPVAGVFVYVRPDLIDFNIHPAKKEARFYDSADLHHGLSSSIKDFFRKYTFANFSEDKATDDIRTPEFSDFLCVPEKNDFGESDFKEDSQVSKNDSLVSKNDSQISEKSVFKESRLFKSKGEESRIEESSFESSVSKFENNLSENIYSKNERYSSIHYKKSETAGETFSDFRSKYLGVKASSLQNSQNQQTDFEYQTKHHYNNEANFNSLVLADTDGVFNSDNEENKEKPWRPQKMTRTEIYDIAEQALNAQNNQNKKDFLDNFSNFSDSSISTDSIDSAEKNICENKIEKENLEPQIKFIGCCLGTFLLAEKNNCLYIIDQHAAHERILFDKLMNSQNETATQQLLIPYKIRTESKTQDAQLEKLRMRLSQIGFTVQKICDGQWEISTVPERWTGSEYDLHDLLFVKHIEPEEIIRSIAAMTACKAAVKDGYVLDSKTAEKLVKQAFLLKDPHCPHGRPIYTVISRDKLFELVKRT